MFFRVAPHLHGREPNVHPVENAPEASRPKSRGGLRGSTVTGTAAPASLVGGSLRAWRRALGVGYLAIVGLIFAGQLLQLNNSDKHRTLLTVGSHLRSVDLGAHAADAIIRALPDMSAEEVELWRGSHPTRGHIPQAATGDLHEGSSGAFLRWLRGSIAR